MSDRFDQCDETCTTDCGHCKGSPVDALRAELADALAENERLRERLDSAGRALAVMQLHEMRAEKATAERDELARQVAAGLALCDKGARADGRGDDAHWDHRGRVWLRADAVRAALAVAAGVGGQGETTNQATTITQMQWDGLRPDGLGDFETDARIIASWVNEHGGEARYHPACRTAECYCAFKAQAIAIRTADGWVYAYPGDTIAKTDEWVNSTGVVCDVKDERCRDRHVHAFTVESAEGVSG